MRPSRLVSVVVSSLCIGAGTGQSFGEEAPAGKPPAKDPFADIKFERGPLVGKLEDLATVDIPETMDFIAGRAESRKFIEATKNLVSNQEVGIVLPRADDEQWWVSFEFDPIGYVKDDEKGSLDADAILESLRAGTERGNVTRKQRGWEELHLIGWHTAPRYNATTQNLEWATRLRGSGGEGVNYNIRLLGRRGVMSVTLVADPQQLEPTLAKLQKLLGGFKYVPEQTYSSYTRGDKIAAYGLTGLVVGGAIAVAAKTGLLAKLWKVLVAGLVVVGGALKKLFGGRKKDDETTT
jgi:uncharacterized membrane-anchored protein